MKIKKIICFLLLVQILSVSLILATSATSDNTLSFTLATDAAKVNVAGQPVYYVGDEIKLTVAVDQNPGFLTATMDVVFDPEVLTFVRPADGVYESDFLDAAAGKKYLVVNEMYTSADPTGPMISGEAPDNKPDEDPAERQPRGVVKITVGDPSTAFAKPETAAQYTENGCFVVLTFKLSETFAGGEVNVSIKANGSSALGLDGKPSSVEIATPATDANGNPVSDSITIMGINPATHTHSFADATCTAPKICIYCAETEGEALGHDIGEQLIDEVPATCEGEGTIAHYICTRCPVCFDVNKVEVDSIVIPATGHAYGEWIEQIDSTCTETGAVAHYDCANCEKNFDENKAEIADIVIPAAGHVLGTLTEKVPATCVDDGTIAYYTCSVCSKNFDENKVEVADIKIAAAGHKYGDLFAKVEATCTKDGSIAHYTCTVCQRSFNENKEAVTDVVISAKGHTVEMLPAVEASEDETGLTAGKKCSTCGEVLEAQESIPMLESGCGGCNGCNGCNGGCGSIIGVSGALIVVTVMGAAVLLKKKED